MRLKCGALVNFTVRITWMFEAIFHLNKSLNSYICNMYVYNNQTIETIYKGTMYKEIVMSPALFHTCELGFEYDTIYSVSHD